MATNVNDQGVSMTAPSQAPVLACRNVNKFFGALAAVNNLSFEVKPGEVFGISGPNGAGKTTLFDVISGLNRADSGDILFDDIDISRLTADRICRMGISRTFQLNAAFGSLTARENVLIAAYYGRRKRIVPGLRFDRETERLADEAIELVGMADEAGSVVKDLPVFYRKLLMLAVAWLLTKTRMGRAIRWASPWAACSPRSWHSLAWLPQFPA